MTGQSYIVHHFIIHYYIIILIFFPPIKRLFRFWKYEIKDYFNKTYCCIVHKFVSSHTIVEISILKSVKDSFRIRYELFMGKEKLMSWPSHSDMEL